MNEELNKQLTGLASKLGVSVEHLWGALVRQAYVDGISSLATTLVCILLAGAAIYGFFYLRRKFKNTPKKDWMQPFGVLTEPTGFLILGIVLLTLGTIASDNLYWVISDLFNPEFFALRHLPFSQRSGYN